MPAGLLHLNNTIQLDPGWLMYSHDNNDMVVGAASDWLAPSWCNGSFDQAPDGVTTLYLTNGPTYPYVGTRGARSGPSEFELRPHCS